MKRGTIVSARTGLRVRLFKDDYPRAIDRYIDYFGETSGPHGDPCGEVFLDDCHAAGRCAAVNE